MSVRVLNKYRATPAEIEGAINIMRPGPWGNPHPVGRYCRLCDTVHDRNGAVDAFKWDIETTLGARERVRRELRGRDLLCCCAPARCHGDVLLRIANE